MSRLGLVLDCHDPERLADFWAAALDYKRAGALGQYVVLAAPEPGQPKLLLQQVPEPKTVKNRVHFDIEVPDIESESARLEALGATRTGPGAMSEHGFAWILMADPEGNEFCVCDGGCEPG